MQVRLESVSDCSSGASQSLPVGKCGIFVNVTRIREQAGEILVMGSCEVVKGSPTPSLARSYKGCQAEKARTWGSLAVSQIAPRMTHYWQQSETEMTPSSVRSVKLASTSALVCDAALLAC